MNTPYEGYIMWGPYETKKGRKILTLFHPITKHRISINHARYVMEIHLGRRLDPDEDVHHKDEDPSNDNLDNLEVTNYLDHRRDHGNCKPRKIITLQCAICKQDFERLESRQRYKLKHNKTGKMYCSVDCQLEGTRV
jgi:hypothetical protein